MTATVSAIPAQGTPRREPRTQHGRHASLAEVASAISILGLQAFDNVVAVVLSRAYSLSPDRILPALKRTDEELAGCVVLVAIVLSSASPKTRGRIVLGVLGGWLLASLILAAQAGWFARAATPRAAPVPPLPWWKRAAMKIQSSWR